MKSFTIYMKDLEEGGLWDNIHKRRKAGKAPKKPGDKGYPKTLDIEGKAYGPTGVSYSDEPNLVSKPGSSGPVKTIKLKDRQVKLKTFRLPNRKEQS